LECMSLAGEYAYAGRDWVCEKVAGILAWIIHDFASKKRKGALKD